MKSSGFTRWAGAAGMLGGILWVVGTVVHAVKPVGCVAEECAGRPMRETSAVEGVLALCAFAFFAVAAGAVVALVHRAGRFGRTGKIGTVLALIGVCVLVAAGLIQAVAFDGDFPPMPYFVVPGIAALIIGVVLLGITILRSGVLSRGAAIVLLVGTLAMLGFNEQTTAAWLAIPFGLGWMAVGYALWSSDARLQSQYPRASDGRP